MNNLDQKELLEKRINKQINQSITKRVVKVLLIICLALASCYYGLDLLYTASNYNPYKEEKIIADNSEESITPSNVETVSVYETKESKNPKDFALMMEIFIKTYYPGYVGFVTEVKDLGFGKYDVGMCIEEYSNVKTYPGLTNVIFHIEGSKLESIEAVDSTSYIFTRLFNEFDEPNNDVDDMDNNVEAIKKEIIEFPDSSYITVSLSFKDYFTLDQFVQMTNTYDANYYWLALQRADDSGFIQVSDGVSLFDNRGYEIAGNRYPQLVWDNELTADKIKERYQSHMQLFFDHLEFIRIFEGYNTLGSKLDNRLKQAKEDIVPFGMKISVKKAVLLEMLEELDIHYVNIQNVRLTRYS